MLYGRYYYAALNQSFHIQLSSEELKVMKTTIWVINTQACNVTMSLPLIFYINKAVKTIP